MISLNNQYIKNTVSTTADPQMLISINILNVNSSQHLIKNSLLGPTRLKPEMALVKGADTHYMAETISPVGQNGFRWGCNGLYWGRFRPN